MSTIMSPTPLHFLITGAGRGIGRGLSRLLISRGHRVFLVDSNETELFHTCDQIAKSLPYPVLQPRSSATSSEPEARAHVAPFDALKCDLRKKGSIREIEFKAREFFGGRLDVLINNAAYTGGVHGPSIADPVDEGAADAFAEAWQASIETNLTAPAMLSRACLPMLRRRGVQQGEEKNSSIIMISSTRARQSEPHSEPYAATKAGLIGLTHSLAVSLKDEGISVNAILPGWINVADECKEADEKGTSWEQSGGMSKEDHEFHLTGRVGRVDDVLRTVLYLVESSDFVTGTESVVDGGVTRRMVYPE